MLETRTTMYDGYYTITTMPFNAEYLTTIERKGDLAGVYVGYSEHAVDALQLHINTMLFVANATHGEILAHFFVLHLPNGGE